jgi:hypothetical protein
MPNVSAEHLASPPPPAKADAPARDAVVGLKARIGRAVVGPTVPWMVLLLLWPGPPANAQDPSPFMDLWLTPDRQGRLAFERGDYARAAKLFADPMWRGIAAYRAYDYLAAAEAFRQIGTATGRFALGNAEAHNHAYEKATAEAPWYVVPADKKWFTRLAVAAAIVEALERLDLGFPKVEGDALRDLARARKVLGSEH